MSSSLFPHIDPHQTGLLPVSDGHTLYFERSGKRGGKPVLFLHGGPGSGGAAKHRRYYDPAVWDIILFDQRGCGRSQPLFDLSGNTTENLIADIEALRRHLGLERWCVFGPSWGSTLGLAYAERHPERVEALVVEGVFLGARAEIDWFHDPAGAGAVHPDALARLTADAPVSAGDPASFRIWALETMQTELAAGRPHLVALADPDTPLDALRRSMIYRWSEFEETLGHMEISPEEIRAGFADKGADWLTAHSLVEAWYFSNDCFLEPDQLIAHADKLTMPVHIVQSRYDMVCPSRSAWRLHQAIPHSELHWVDRSGHVMGEAAHAVLRQVFRRLPSRHRSGWF